MTCQRSHSKAVAELGLEPGQAGSEICALGPFLLRKWFRVSLLSHEDSSVTQQVLVRACGVVCRLQKTHLPIRVMQGGFLVALIPSQVS